jgi:signal transduction histidine kinase
MSLRLRLLAAFAFVLVLILVAIEVPLALSLADRVTSDIEDNAAVQAQAVATAASGQLARPEALDEIVRDSADELGGRVIVVDRQGRLLADSAGEELSSVSYADRPEVAAALAGQTSQGTRFSETLDQDLLYTAVPVFNAGRTVGATRVTQSVEAVQARVRRNVLALAGVGVVALVLGLALAWIVAGSLARPLRELARTARRVEQGDLDARVEPSGASEQREVAHAFNDMTERLGQSLAAQREFVGNASHQLRTPLTSLRLRLEAASLKTDDEDAQRDLLAAELELERLSRLLSSLLALAREGERPTVVRPTALGDACTRAGGRWQVHADETEHRLDLTEGPEVHVRASEEDVTIVLDNLIENALRYSPGGTPITLAWDRVDGTGRLSVLDEGPGVAEDEESKLFERFARGSSSKGTTGTGLGLAIVATLARRWGGSARILRRAEGGSRAEVCFPLAEPLPSPNPELDRILPGRV